MNETKTNKLARRMGVILCESGMRMIRSAFKIDPYEFSKEKLGTFIKGELGVYPSMADKKYYTVDIGTWNSIVKIDFTDRKRYLKEKYDCDNFAYSFSARMAEIFDLTGAGITHCHIYNKFTGKYINGHFFTSLVVEENGKLKLYFLEPMNDQIVEYEKGKKIIIGNWIYKVSSLRFF